MCAVLGWSPRWQAFLAVAQGENDFPLTAGRVSSVHRGAVDVLVMPTDGHELTSRRIDLRDPGHCTDDERWPVVVGDWVALDEEQHIRVILPRTTYLSRPDPAGTSMDQAIAANIDVLLVVEPMPVSLGRVERMMTLARAAGCEGWLVITKTDLAEHDEVVRSCDAAQRVADRVDAISMYRPATWQPLLDILQSGKTAVLIGRSGAGKSTLVNALTGASQVTAAVRSRDGKGRHTTTSRQLIAHDGFVLIDTPGIRALAAIHDADAIDEVYRDIAAQARQCRYSTCTHVSEPGCAVLAAVDDGSLDASYLHRYHRMLRESQRQSIRSSARLAREQERRRSKDDTRGRRGVMKLKGRR